jgi:hypothetical protein
MAPRCEFCRHLTGNPASIFSYLENSVNALIKGTPKEMASSPSDTAKPNLKSPVAWVIKDPQLRIDTIQTRSRNCRRVIIFGNVLAPKM